MFSALSAYFGGANEALAAIESLATAKGKQDLMATQRRLANLGRAPNAGRVVSELQLSFWKYLLASRYEASLWTPALRHAFPKMTIKSRQKAQDAVEHLHFLRNRLAHHERVIDRDLQQDFESLKLLLGWVSPDALNWALENLDSPL
jgi:hypothetical protein